MKKIIIDDAVPYAQAIFSHLGEVVCLPGKAINASHVADADALIIRSRTQINADLLNNSTVKFVGSTVVGLDHVDQNFLTQAGIHFYSAQGCNANSVAEYIISALYYLAEQQGFCLTDKTLAIIGVGHVGKKLQQKAETLGIKLLLNDPIRQQNEPENAAQFCHLDTALAADIISFHTPLTHDGAYPTYHLLSANKVAQLKPHQIVINAARGGIIDEAAWATQPLQAKLIDCWQNEPNIDEALYQSANLATPHIAGHSLEAKVAGSHMVYQALCEFWQQPQQNNWQTHLPQPPAPIKLNAGTQQQQLCQLFQACYAPQQDDLALRDDDFKQTQQKYENYRRHYPIHREWHLHQVVKTSDSTVNNLIEKLGFRLID